MVLFVLLLAMLAGKASAEETTFEQLTRDGRFKQRPAWSPDGKQLVVARLEPLSMFLYLYEPGQSEPRRLTDREFPEFDAVWSPDASQLAFTLDNASPNQGDMEVYRMDASGKNLQVVAGTDGALSHEESPAWSPDGQWIAFTSTRDGNQELYIARPDGKDAKRLTTDPAIDAHPCWSPDSQRIVFVTNRWGDMELALLDVASSQLTRLTESRGLDDYPAWSPDGRWIAFATTRSGNLDIYCLAPETGELVQRTQHPAIDNYPCWHPDGRLTFVSNRNQGFEVFIEARKPMSASTP